MLLADIDGAGWVAIITALGGLVGTIIAGIATVIKLIRRDNVTDARIDLWSRAHLRRGLVEGLKGPYITEHEGAVDATYQLTREARTAYEPIAPTLRRLWAEQPKGTLAERFVEVIEERIGEWLVKHICQPLNVMNFACLQIALMISMEPDVPDVSQRPQDPTDPSIPVI